MADEGQDPVVTGARGPLRSFLIEMAAMRMGGVMRIGLTQDSGILLTANKVDMLAAHVLLYLIDDLMQDEHMHMSENVMRDFRAILGRAMFWVDLFKKSIDAMGRIERLNEDGIDPIAAMDEEARRLMEEEENRDDDVEYDD